jgi:hypothetical protein
LDWDQLGKDVNQSEKTETKPEDLPEAPIADTLLSRQVETEHDTQTDPEAWIGPDRTSPQVL